MVTISKPLSAGQAQTYHRKEFTSESQNYWGRSGAVQGEWQGQLTGKFGLSGGVGAEQFAALTEGRHPQTGEQMVRHREAQEYTDADGVTAKAVEHRAGWDATFSAPKSVSLTALVGGDERVREAHRAAVSTALSELERYTQARIGGNHPAETTGTFVAAKFEHDTARPVDGYAAPQLHTHAVIFNVTEREDGPGHGKQMRALQPRSLFDSQNYATAVYQSELTYELRNLGYEIEPGRSGAPEIKGFTQEYLDASSPRSQQIRDYLERTGYRGPEAAQIAAHSTRDGKQILTPDQVLNAHQQLAADFGNQAERVVAEARARALTQAERTDAPGRAREAVSYARASLFEREAVSDERGIMRDALRRGMGETPYAEVRAEFDTRRNRGEFLPVPGQKHDTGGRFTTPETIAAERANVEQMRAGKNAVEPMMTADQAAAQAQTRDLLNPAQRAVIEEVLTSCDRIHGLQGLAGTGKTTVLASIKEGAERNGYAVEGFAPTSKATGQLREAGIPADTLQSFLARGGRERMAGDPDNRHLYLLDESSLASTRQIGAFFESIGPQDRVLVIGDIRQHQGVDAGKPFEQMQDAGMQTALLDRIMRQKDPELRSAVEHLSRNQTVSGIGMLQEQGRITEIVDPKERFQGIAKDYAARPESTLIVSPDNASRRKINQAVRTELQAQGVLAKIGLEFSTLVQRSDMTGADRGWAARYGAGDILQYIKGSREQGIERGSFATVVSAGMRENTLTVRRADGQSVTYDPARLKGVNVYREGTREIASGDRIQFTAPDRKLGVANRDLGTVQKVEPDRLTVKLDGKHERTVSFDPSKMRHFDHGYAVTSHSSQGLTANRVLANMDTEAPRALINTRLAYVAVSRAAEDTRIYTNDAASLGTRLATDVSKSAAVDFRTPSQSEQPRRSLETLGRNDTGRGVDPVQQTVRAYADPQQRVSAVARDYAAQPDRAVVVAPHRAEHGELTSMIRHELQQTGVLRTQGRSLPVLVERSEFNPRLAADYAPGDAIRFRAGNPDMQLAPNSLATVVAVDGGSRNQLTIHKSDGMDLTYNPALLRKETGQSTVYREERREIAPGERIRFTATDKVMGVRANDFGTVVTIGENSGLTVRTDRGRTVELDPMQARHIEHGYVVDGSKAVAADRVLVSLDTPQLLRDSPISHPASRASQEAVIYTSAQPSVQDKAKTPVQPSSQIEQNVAPLASDRFNEPVRSTRLVLDHEQVPTWEEHSRRWTPLNNVLSPGEASQFAWKAETGTIQTYGHLETNRHIHIDGPSGTFYDEDRHPITKGAALDHAAPGSHEHRSEGPAQNFPARAKPAIDNAQSIGF